MSLEARNTALVLRFFEEASQSDQTVEQRFRLLADDGVWWIAGQTFLSGRWSKLERLRRSAEFNRTLCADMVITPDLDGVTAQGERVAIEARSSATNRLTGAAYANRYHWLFIVREDRIVEIREYMDTQHLVDIFGDGPHENASGDAISGRL